MSSSSPLTHCVAKSPHNGHRGSNSIIRNSYSHFRQRCTRGTLSMSSSSEAKSVSFTNTSNPNCSESRLTPDNSHDLHADFRNMHSGMAFRFLLYTIENRRCNAEFMHSDRGRSVLNVHIRTQRPP